eukprot:m.69163 g.69163  ORF g.69163 m.69163 type:complete len:788 (+) comp7537_c0_seq1:1099-3462(+)
MLQPHTLRTCLLSLPRHWFKSSQRKALPMTMTAMLSEPWAASVLSAWRLTRRVPRTSPTQIAWAGGSCSSQICMWRSPRRTSTRRARPLWCPRTSSRTSSSRRAAQRRPWTPRRGLRRPRMICPLSRLPPRNRHPRPCRTRPTTTTNTKSPLTYHPPQPQARMPTTTARSRRSRHRSRLPVGRRQYPCRCRWSSRTNTLQRTTLPRLDPPPSRACGLRPLPMTQPRPSSPLARVWPPPPADEASAARDPVAGKRPPPPPEIEEDGYDSVDQLERVASRRLKAAPMQLQGADRLSEEVYDSVDQLEGETPLPPPPARRAGAPAPAARPALVPEEEFYESVDDHDHPPSASDDAAQGQSSPPTAPDAAPAEAPPALAAIAPGSTSTLRGIPLPPPPDEAFGFDELYESMDAVVSAVEAARASEVTSPTESISSPPPSSLPPTFSSASLTRSLSGAGQPPPPVQSRIDAAARESHWLFGPETDDEATAQKLLADRGHGSFLVFERPADDSSLSIFYKNRLEIQRYRIVSAPRGLQLVGMSDYFATLSELIAHAKKDTSCLGVRLITTLPPGATKGEPVIAAAPPRPARRPSTITEETVNVSETSFGPSANRRNSALRPPPPPLPDDDALPAPPPVRRQSRAAPPTPPEEAAPPPRPARHFPSVSSARPPPPPAEEEEITNISPVRPAPIIPSSNTPLPDGWDCRHLSRTEAVNRMNGKAQGFFLVRESREGYAALSVVSLNNAVYHVHIQSSPRGLHLKNCDPTFPDIETLIRHYATPTQADLPVCLRLT